MTLTDFLLARIAEDEEVARAAFRDEHPSDVSYREPRKDDGRWSTGDHEMDAERIEGVAMTIYDEGGHNAERARHIARHDPARVLAECEAKRRIVENCERARAATDAEPLSEKIKSSDSPTSAYWRGQAWACRVLAAVYAGHPDFREEWRV